MFLIDSETDEETKIGEVELIYFAGSRAMDAELDLVDVSDSVGQEEWEYAEAVYTDGVLGSKIVGDVISNDLLAIDSMTLSPEYRERKYGARIVVAVDHAIGYHCGAMVVRPEGIETADADPDVIAEREPEYIPQYQLVPTRNPSIRVVSFP